MADYGHSKKKRLRNVTEPEGKSRNKCPKGNSKHNAMDSKTPPLPARRSSIEDLIKQRETLKKELKKFTKHSDSNLNANHTTTKKEKNRKHSRSDYTYEVLSRKRRRCDYNNINTVKKKQPINEASPERNGDYAQIESEDEETVIAKRRQERRKFIEQLNISQEKRHERKFDANTERRRDIGRSNDNIKHKNTKLAEINSTSIKETTDMFSERDDFTSKHAPDHVTQDNDTINSQLIDNWDDSDGYYNIRIGDIINNKRYTIKSILGQGVFANVIRAQDSKTNTEVAIKIIRNNELMYKTGLKEIAFLKEITEADPENKYHCVRLLTHFMHKGHLCIVLESLFMDLRGVIKKYGKHHGLNMKALMSYSRQLLVALRLLKKIGIVHADIKPDNILVNEKKNILKLCDFGSATNVHDKEPTPYLVSRFYRAPEIILGVPFRHSVDIWSTACTIYEMATGKIMFTGSSNNKMLKCFMDLKGKFPAKLIRKGKFKDQHFNYNNNFLLHKKDEFSGREKVIEVSSFSINRDLHKELKKPSKPLFVEEEKKILQLKDILDKMLTLDSNQRLTVTDCLKHPFIQEELKKVN